MASISSVGIGSGVLTSELIDKLVAAERGPTEKRLGIKEADITTELSVFGQIMSAVTDLRLPSRTLADPKAFNQLAVVSGNSAFSGTATSSAAAGSYSLEVTTLAKSHSLSTDEFADADSTQMGTGTLAITVNGETTNIVIDGSNNTLNGIAAAINEDNDIAVTASVINTGSGYKLVFSSDETGVENAIDIAVTDTGDGNNTDALGLSRLSYTAGGLNLNENQAATDSAFSLNGIAITRSSNTVDDVISGVTLTLSSTNTGAPASLVVKRETASIVDSVQKFLDKFNALQTLITDNTKFNPDNPESNGVLLGDSATRTILTQIRNIMGRTIQGLESASVRSMADLGISTDKDTGLMSFESAIFVSKLNADPDSVAAIFADQGRTTDGQVEFVQAGLNTKVGTYDIEISQIATKGANTGTVSLGGATLIDASNDSLTVTIDGVLSNAITLATGTYTAEELAAEIQSKINADSNLVGAEKSVAVSLDGSNQLVISSAIFGASSKVEINTVDTNTAAQLGLAVGVGVDGLDVAGTINGVAGTGSGQFLTAAEGDDSESIRLKITGGATGDRGSVSYIEGVGENLVDLINNFLRSDGVITVKNDRLNAELGSIAEERAKMDLRIVSLTERLVRQFTAADILISRLNSTQDFISQQLDALVSSTRKTK